MTGEQYFGNIRLKNKTGALHFGMPVPSKNGTDFFRRLVTEEGQELRPYYCYIVRCRDDSLYTGITNDVERRIAVHNKGKGGAYTASRCPVELVYSECVGAKGDALRRELEIKSLTRSQKLALIGKKHEG